MKLCDRFITMVSSLIAWLWVRSQNGQNQWWTLPQILICGSVPDACLWLGPPWLKFRFSEALIVCKPGAIFFAQQCCTKYINLIWFFSVHFDALHKLGMLRAGKTICLCFNNSRIYGDFLWLFSCPRRLLGPQGFWGSGENGYLFSGSLGALVIISGDIGSKLIVLGIYGALPKSKKIKEKSPFCLSFLKISSASWGLTPRPVPLLNAVCIPFRTNMLI